MYVSRPSAPACKFADAVGPRPVFDVREVHYLARIQRGHETPSKRGAPYMFLKSVDVTPWLSALRAITNDSNVLWLGALLNCPLFPRHRTGCFSRHVFTAEVCLRMPATSLCLFSPCLPFSSSLVCSGERSGRSKPRGNLRARGKEWKALPSVAGARLCSSEARACLSLPTESCGA